MVRVVFHPDYTFSDFVGQILPQTDGEKISYPFIPGPFTRILRKAIFDPDHMYYLIIEEISRGNASAIFGDIFHLLDRKNGESEYSITNYDIARKIYGKGHEEKGIKLPSNLTILATMNTADQNVFPLDAAFKRRWGMRCIENNFQKCPHKDEPICGTRVTWREFADKINDAIIDINQGSLSNEDARLGAYFVQKDELCDETAFSEKVLMYLWTDAFKRDRARIFKPEYKTFEALINGFAESKFDIFNRQFGFDNTPVDDDNTSVSTSEYLDKKLPIYVELYKQLYERLKLHIENIDSYTTKTKKYIGITAPNCKTKSFVDVMISTKSIALYMEKPTGTALLQLGAELSYDHIHNHYFKIEIFDNTNLDDVVSAICQSYEQLKKEN